MGSPVPLDSPLRNEAYSSGVSWAAVIAGAFVAAALSLILLALGTGFGLASISPWSNTGASASTIGAVAIIWLIVIQIVSSALGGYLAGRLRTKWTALHTDEVYFRDTAHGFLVWAVGLVVTASFLTTAAAAMAGGMAPQPRGAVGGPVSGPYEYFVDTLFRSTNPSQPRSEAAVHAEVERILANALRHDDIPPTDRTYLTELVVARSGASQPEAEKRVTDTMTEVRQAADIARKATAHLLLWTFLALLIGAFCASYAATIGGRQRDHVMAI